jgi:hypothetical protein
MEFLRQLLSTEGYHPHGYCYLWQPGLIWLHVISDALIGLAYVTIGMALAMFVRRGRGELPFSRMFLKHVDDLLDVARLEAGQMEIRYQGTDLARLLRFTASHFEATTEAKAFRLSVEAPESLPVEVDAEKIRRVLFNLLGNAVKFTPEGGRIRCVLSSASRPQIEGSHRDETVRIEIHDSGPGIPAEQRKKIFEPFRQGDGGPARRYGGTGLGLAIVSDFRMAERSGPTSLHSAEPFSSSRFPRRRRADIRCTASRNSLPWRSPSPDRQLPSLRQLEPKLRRRSAREGRGRAGRGGQSGNELVPRGDACFGLSGRARVQRNRGTPERRSRSDRT